MIKEKLGPDWGKTKSNLLKDLVKFEPGLGQDLVGSGSRVGEDQVNYRGGLS